MRCLSSSVALFLTLCCAGAAYAITYDVVLDPGQEIPIPTLNGSTPAGMATVDVNTLDGTVTVSGSYSGMTSDVTGSHLHGLAPAGTPAGVLFGVTNSAGTSGTLTGTGTLSATDLDGLLDGLTYLNVHTANNGPGEIRGQVIDSDIQVFRIALDAAQAVPAPNLGGATPSGQATVVVDTSTGLIEITGSYTGTTSDVSNAHLHGFADAGTPAGVLFGLSPTGGTAGTFGGSSTLDATQLAEFLAGRTYINVHTAMNGSGEIRGQVVPEPSTFTITLLASLLGLFLVRRR